MFLIGTLIETKSPGVKVGTWGIWENDGNVLRLDCGDELHSTKILL